VLELSDAHRLGRPSSEDVRNHTWRIDSRGYHLLLGLRQRRDWTSLRSRSFDAALDSLRGSFGLVVADADDDLDGERATGSVDLEERNAMARSCVREADVVVAVGSPDLAGIHHLLRVVRDTLDVGVGPGRLLPTFNRSSGGRRQRAELDRTFGRLHALAGAPAVATPLHVPTRKGIDLAVRDGEPFPSDWVAPLASAVGGLLANARTRADRTGAEPVPIQPGELGTWADDERAEEAG
jgi:hypothetical protein